MLLWHQVDSLGIRINAVPWIPLKDRSCWWGRPLTASHRTIREGCGKPLVWAKSVYSPGLLLVNLNNCTASGARAFMPEQGVFKAIWMLVRDNKPLRVFRNPLAGSHSTHTGEWNLLAVELHTHAHTQLTSK